MEGNILAQIKSASSLNAMTNETGCPLSSCISVDAAECAV